MQLPNGPQTPALWQMLHWIAHPFSYMNSCAQRYGGIFTTPPGKHFSPVVFVSHPQAIQHILTSDAKEYDAPGEQNGLFEPFLGKQSVIAVSGERHRRQRQLMMPPFHRERMRAYGQLIGDITEQVINQWQMGKPFSVRSFMQTLVHLKLTRPNYSISARGIAR
jgi:cytochrome P450